MGKVRFLGIDLGWRGQPSGLAALEWTGAHLELLALERRSDANSILEWIDRYAGEGASMVAVDAPLVIPNLSGMRPADREAHIRFGRFHAGAYPANLGQPYAARTIEFSRALDLRGFMHGVNIEPRSEGRYQIEVHPHAASVHLFDLERILKYKKGRFGDRAPELERLRHFIQSELPKLTPALREIALPAVPDRASGLKAIEDQLDAVLCAYIGAHWWYWGLEQNLVLGNRTDGYIIVPARRAAGSISLGSIREEYMGAGLDERHALDNPFEQFRIWLDDALAANLREPNAMTLATADPKGRPSARIVLLKSFDERGFVFYTSYASRKSAELEKNPRAALLFYWPDLVRQVRIEGTVRRVSRRESADYFRTRPAGSRLGAWASRQSAVIPDRAWLDQRIAEAERRFTSQEIPVPEYWGGFRLTPTAFEFWQGRPNRLHDRLRYRKTARGWRRDRLAP